MGKSEFEKSMLKAVPNHTHKYTATLITGTGGEGEIYLRCEDTCPIGSSITFPRNPRKYYGEQIAREIERAHKCGHERDEVSGCKCCDWNWYGVGCSHVADAAIARGGHDSQ